MKYPILYEMETSRQMLDVFRGYNHNLRISDGEFYDMKNLTSTHYPVLSPRGKRGKYLSVDNPKGMIAKDSLCYVDGSYFVINEKKIDLGLDAYETVDLVSMGAHVIILTKDADGNSVDKKYINTANLTDFGNIEASFTTQADVSFSLCKLDGGDYANAVPSPTEPENPNNMDLWIDTSSTPHSLKQYSETTKMWVSVATTYVKISSSGIGAAFKQYDGVTISGIKSEKLKDLNASMVLWEVYHNEEENGKGDYIVVIGILDEVTTQTVAEGQITIERKMPAMDFVIESGNRLWGCRYGLSNNKEVVNEIYASKLGDFKNWNCFMSVATDSCVLQCGTDGQFTGAITHLGYPVFFKENCMHKVYGNYPANYQTQSTVCRGVQEGSEKSLAIVNEVLYYKSRNGVCAYDGSLPAEVSYALGDVYYDNAVACGHGNKYYISMRDAKGEYHLFVYDVSKDMWHREDNLAVKALCSCRNDVYFIPKDGTEIKTLLGSGTQDTAPVSWMAETGVMGTSMPDKKYISRLNIRMSVDVGTRVYLYIQYDSMGEWERVATITGTNLRSFTLPVRPKRCDHMRMRIVGEGDAKIFSITKTIEEGSEN